MANTYAGLHMLQLEINENERKTQERTGASKTKTYNVNMISQDMNERKTSAG